MPSNPKYLAWLHTTGPDVWYEIVHCIGEWDGDLADVEWIVCQPLCYRASAVRVFEACEGPEWLMYPDRDALEATKPLPDALRNFDISKLVADRWSAGLYQPTPFEAFGLDEVYQDYMKKFKHVPFAIADEMFDRSTGPKRPGKEAQIRIGNDFRAIGLHPIRDCGLDGLWEGWR